MLLIPGYTSLRGVVLNGVEADHFRSLIRQLKRHVDARRPVEAQQVLDKIKSFAGDSESYRQIFEIVRREEDERWRQLFRTSWAKDLKKCTDRCHPTESE
jgi:hypothetical protein